MGNNVIVDPFTDGAFELGRDSRMLVVDTTSATVPLLASNTPFSEIPDNLNITTTATHTVTNVIDADGTKDVYYPFKIQAEITGLTEGRPAVISYTPTGYLTRDFLVKYVKTQGPCNALVYRWDENGIEPFEGDSSVYFESPDFSTTWDEITPELWLSRGDNSGLFNAVSETMYEEIGWNGPADTEWAFAGHHGNPDSFTVDDAPNLFFLPWRYAIDGNPPDMVGLSAIVRVISTNTYIPILFTGWTAGDGGGGSIGGGFSYRRPDTSNPPECIMMGQRTLPLGWIPFCKPSEADGTLPEYQDIISETVAFARGTSGGLYNVHPGEYVEPDYGYGSPFGTSWAFLGFNGNTSIVDDFTIDNVDALTFAVWEDAHQTGPIDVVGIPAIVRLDFESDLYFYLTTTRWDSGEVYDSPGFCYIRSGLLDGPMTWYNVSSENNFIIVEADWGSDIIPMELNGSYLASSGPEPSYESIGFIVEGDYNGTSGLPRWTGIRPTRIKVDTDASFITVYQLDTNGFQEPLITDAAIPQNGVVRINPTGDIVGIVLSGGWTYVNSIEINAPLNPPAPVWHDITDPSFWVSPLGANTTWTGTEWSIYTDGMSNGSPSFLRATPETITNYFMPGTQIRLTGNSPNKITLYYETIYSVQTDSLYYADIPHPIVDVARAIPTPIMNAKADWIGFSPADRYNGGTSTISKIEILAPPLV